MELVRVKIHPCLHISNERVVGPAVPQARHNVKEFPCPAIPGSMRNMFLTTEIHRLMRVARGHHVPARPPATDVIQRGKLPRNMIRLVVGRGGGGDEPQVLRHDGQGR